jgi:hypothetical protein
MAACGDVARLPFRCSGPLANNNQRPIVNIMFLMIGRLPPQPPAVKQIVLLVPGLLCMQQPRCVLPADTASASRFENVFEHI